MLASGAIHAFSRNRLSSASRPFYRRPGRAFTTALCLRALEPIDSAGAIATREDAEFGISGPPGTIGTVGTMVPLGGGGP